MSKTPFPAALLCLVLSMVAGPSKGQVPAERLIAPAPPGYRLAQKVEVQSSTIEILRPPGQGDDNWSNQLTLQTSKDKVKAHPSEVLKSLEKTLASSCKELTAGTIASGKVNGYATATTLLKWPLVTTTGKPEASLIHAIAGSDHMYIVHQSLRHAPTPDDLKQMIRYLGTVTVCDGRTPDHPCPAPKPAP